MKEASSTADSSRCLPGLVAVTLDKDSISCATPLEDPSFGIDNSRCLPGLVAIAAVEGAKVSQTDTALPKLQQ